MPLLGHGTHRKPLLSYEVSAQKFPAPPETIKTMPLYAILFLLTLGLAAVGIGSYIVLNKSAAPGMLLILSGLVPLLTGVFLFSRRASQSVIENFFRKTHSAVEDTCGNCRTKLHSTISRHEDDLEKWWAKETDRIVGAKAERWGDELAVEKQKAYKEGLAQGYKTGRDQEWD